MQLQLHAFVLLRYTQYSARGRLTLPTASRKHMFYGVRWTGTCAEPCSLRLSPGSLCAECATTASVIICTFYDLAKAWLQCCRKYLAALGRYANENLCFDSNCMITDLVQLMIGIDSEFAGELGTTTYRGGSFDNGAQRDVLASVASLAGVCGQTLPTAHFNGFGDCCRNEGPFGFRIQYLAGRVHALPANCGLLSRSTEWKQSTVWLFG